MAVAWTAGPASDATQVPQGRSLDSRPLGAAGPNAAAHGPVIVLAPAYSGASRLRSLLDGHPDLACTSGTGILPLCEQAIAAWRSADGQAARAPSQLAVTATRALASSIITALLAREGKWRWCEIIVANTQVAETFLRIYPGATFLCLYRACPDVIRAALDGSPWGIADPVFLPFTRAYPASTATALTAYWVAHTTGILEFERAHSQACLRIRFEDLTAAQHETAARISSFLGLEGQAVPPEDSGTRPESGGTGPAAEFPVDLIPPAMLAQANDLLRQLGYPSL
jgi:protein-tyrosine sulfotransferase